MVISCYAEKDLEIIDLVRPLWTTNGRPIRLSDMTPRPIFSDNDILKHKTKLVLVITDISIIFDRHCMIWKIVRGYVFIHSLQLYM